MVGLSCPAPLLQAVARKRQQSRHASRVLLQVDRVVWQLCTLARDQLFVQVGVTLGLPGCRCPRVPFYCGSVPSTHQRLWLWGFCQPALSDAVQGASLAQCLLDLPYS